VLQWQAAVVIQKHISACDLGGSAVVLCMTVTSGPVYGHTALHIHHHQVVVCKCCVDNSNSRFNQLVYHLKGPNCTERHETPAAV
jgi:hypothetical protein